MNLREQDGPAAVHPSPAHVSWSGRVDLHQPRGPAVAGARKVALGLEALQSGSVLRPELLS